MLRNNHPSATNQCCLGSIHPSHTPHSAVSPRACRPRGCQLAALCLTDMLLATQCRFVFYDVAPMMDTRPAEATKELVPDAQPLQAWLEANRERFAQHFA